MMKIAAGIGAADDYEEYVKQELMRSTSDMFRGNITVSIKTIIL